MFTFLHFILFSYEACRAIRLCMPIEVGLFIKSLEPEVIPGMISWPVPVKALLFINRFCCSFRILYWLPADCYILWLLPSIGNSFWVGICCNGISSRFACWTIPPILKLELEEPLMPPTVALWLIEWAWAWCPPFVMFGSCPLKFWKNDRKLDKK